MCDRIECSILRAEVDIKRYVAQLGVDVHGEMSVRQQCHEGNVAALLPIGDDLQGDEIEFSDDIGDFGAQRFFIGTFFSFAIVEIHCQQP